MHPTNNFCERFAGRSRAALIALTDEHEKRGAALEIARGMMLARTASPQQLEAACDTLTHHGDHIDVARAEMLRARIRRDLRTAAETLIAQGGAA